MRRVAVKPSTALGVAAVLENRERFAGRRVATILCGSNVTTDVFARWALGQRVSDSSGVARRAPDPKWETCAPGRRKSGRSLDPTLQ
jgi:threonine dehydratase